MTKTINMEIISKEDQLVTKNEGRQKMVDLLTARIDAKNKDLQSKKYIVQGGNDVADLIVSFLRDDAQWKFSEALGIIEASNQVKEGIAGIKTKKAKELFVPALAIEAIYYFLTKVESKGIDAAEKYVSLLKPVSDALGRSKQDREVIDQLTRDRATLESAIDNNVDIADEDTILKEIQAELAKEI